MYLLVTLGHNSSAILLNESGELITGYEEERLTRIKSDSSFPKNAIEECLKYYDPPKNANNHLFISHWFDDFDFIKNKTFKQKRFDLHYINELQEKYDFDLNLLSDNFTHHDAHAYSAFSFYKNHIRFGNNLEHVNILIADGFGNKEEVISIYKIESGNPVKTHSISGYNKSLGLMYQYATDFIGLKMNQDEYKLLGYEPDIDNAFTKYAVNMIDNYINIEYTNLFAKIVAQPFQKKGTFKIDSEINLENLTLTKKYWHDFFRHICNLVGVDKESDDAKVVVAYTAQSLIENVVRGIIGFYGLNKTLIVSGGIFYNVKLNNSLLSYVKRLCVPPLAGDQGAGIGVYEYFTQLDFPYKDLKWGKRILRTCGQKNVSEDVIKNIFYFTNKNDFIDFVVEKINDEDAIVNIFGGNMEFGPRALCNTSTLANPQKENVRIINALNNRDEKMPMAPVLLESNFNYFFDGNQTRKVIGSEKYMIMTFLYNDFILHDGISSWKYLGIMHKIPHKQKYSGRPQIVNENSIMKQILSQVKNRCLINTSFNIHGKPIVFGIEDAYNDFEYQYKMKKSKHINKNIYLVVGVF